MLYNKKNRSAEGIDREELIDHFESNNDIKVYVRAVDLSVLLPNGKSKTDEIEPEENTIKKSKTIIDEIQKLAPQ